MGPDLSPGDRGQRAFRASDASPQWNNPPKGQGWALKQKGSSAAYIQSDVCATPSVVMGYLDCLTIGVHATFVVE